MQPGGTVVLVLRDILYLSCLLKGEEFFERQANA